MGNDDYLTVTDINVEKKLKKIQARTQKHLDLYARDGLRTLCIAKKVRENSSSGGLLLSSGTGMALNLL
jgi:hypothetical protein